MADNIDRRVIVYPTYLNAKRTIAEGRKIAKGKACDDPQINEVYDCVTQGLKLQAECERKCYPREWWILGRVRVELYKPDGTPITPEIPNRRVLMEKIAELVPRHPGRSKKAQAQAAAAKAAVEKAAAACSAASSKSSGKSNKKKGKK